MAKTEKGAPAQDNKASEILEVGVATQEQIDAWKKEYANEGDVKVLKVKVSENETAVGYLKPASRIVVAKCMSLYADKQVLQTGEFLLANCWLGGDERIRTNAKISLAAAVQANSMVEFLEAELGNA